MIPAHRAERTIRRAVDSVLAAPGLEPTVIVVVDGKLDDAQAVLADYPSDRVRVLTNVTPQGAAQARNRGLEEVASTYVMFLDADDFVEGPLLADLMQRMDAASADVGFGPFEALNEHTGERQSRFVPDFHSSTDVIQGWHVGDRYVGCCSVVWRTDFVRSIGGWDPDLTRNDDGELVLRAILKGARFVNAQRGCGVYVKHSHDTLSNRTDNLDSLMRANEKLLAIESDSVDREVQVGACAANYYKIAWQCFYAGEDELGGRALHLSRSLGFSGHLGPRSFRTTSAILGLRSAARFARLRRRLVGHPLGPMSRGAA